MGWRSVRWGQIASDCVRPFSVRSPSWRDGRSIRSFLIALQGMSSPGGEETGEGGRRFRRRPDFLFHEPPSPGPDHEPEYGLRKVSRSSSRPPRGLRRYGSQARSYHWLATMVPKVINADFRSRALGIAPLKLSAMSTCINGFSCRACDGSGRGAAFRKLDGCE